VDPDALPTSEKPSPAAPSIVKAAVVCFCFEACLTLGMVASSNISCEEMASVRPANPAHNYLG
jgi:hypothetical protein